MCSVLGVQKEKSLKHTGYKHVLPSQSQKHIFPFPYILSVAYLLASAKYNIPLLWSTASKLLCGFCSTPGILQINWCTGFVLKKAFVCFQIIYLAKQTGSSSVLSPRLFGFHYFFAAVSLKEIKGTRDGAELEWALPPVPHDLCPRTTLTPPLSPLTTAPMCMLTSQPGFSQRSRCTPIAATLSCF